MENILIEKSYTTIQVKICRYTELPFRERVYRPDILIDIRLTKFNKGWRAGEQFNVYVYLII